MDCRLPGDEDRLAPHRHVSLPLLGLALACAVPFAILTAWARFSSLAGWELELVLALRLPEGPWRELVGVLNTLGEFWLWAPIVLAASLGLIIMRRSEAALLVGLTLLADLAGLVIKLLVERARPEGAIVEHLFGGESFAFPSGHVLRATALAAVAVWLAAPPRWRLPAALIGALAGGLVMGYARVAAGVHWPSDVLGGLLIGVAWFGLTAAVVDKPTKGEGA